MRKNHSGFTIVQVIVAIGMLSGATLLFMNLSKNVGDSQRSQESKVSEVELRQMVSMILSDEKHCRISLAGEGPYQYPTSPVTFNKTDIDEFNEGLDIALYLANQVGDARETKKLNGADNPGTEDKSRFSRLRITSMKLLMNNGVGSNYTDDPSHTDIGVIRVFVEKKISLNQTREIALDFNINLELSTGQAPESSGETRIISCTSNSMGLIGSSIRTYLADECKVCIACSDDSSWNGMVVCDSFDNNGWRSSGRDHCADQGRLAIKVVCGTDSFSDSNPNSSP